MSRNTRPPPACGGERPRSPAHVASIHRWPEPENPPDSAAEARRGRRGSGGAPRSVNLSLRWRVLKRDNFRCVACGRSPATELGCELHVDHIVPASKGGAHRLDNLRTLCAACNFGRGNRE